MIKRVRLTKTMEFDVEYDGRTFPTDEALILFLNDAYLSPGGFIYKDGKSMRSTGWGRRSSTWHSYEVIE
jgi:hypothetical protein